MKDTSTSIIFSLLLLLWMPLSTFGFVVIPSQASSSITPTKRIQRSKSDHSLHRDMINPVLTAVVASTTIPIKEIVLASFLPPLLGYYKSEYTVSYAYGLATSIAASLLLPTTSTTVARYHAAALIFYGCRLDLYLLYRQLFVPRFRKLIERVEERANSKGGRISRTPFILSCGLLYVGLVSPVILTSQLTEVSSKAAQRTIQLLVSITWFGFILGALGDLQKSWSKAKRGEGHLVRGGIYSVFRHPNYTGEIIAWTASYLAGFVSALTQPSKRKLVFVFLSFIGVLGIDFVLFRATSGLEKRQQETYGNVDGYQQWIESSWSGFHLPSKGS